MRDNYGITQCIIDKENSNFSNLEKIQLETVIKIDGKVVNRSGDTINKEIDIPKELSNLFDKEEKMTILPNSTIDVKNFILEKISNA